MVANIFPLFGLKIDVSVTSPHYPRWDSGSPAGSRVWDEGKSHLPSHLPRDRAQDWSLGSSIARAWMS